mmetsp:Transcript_76008/g.220777  ORF Transcript_76008/g.220777 Transcript_76008/m.220777 type:complete len:202 (+) Transcript_76008:835-1440(+)
MDSVLRPRLRTHAAADLPHAARQRGHVPIDVASSGEAQQLRMVLQQDLAYLVICTVALERLLADHLGECLDIDAAIHVNGEHLADGCVLVVPGVDITIPTAEASEPHHGAATQHASAVAVESLEEQLLELVSTSSSNSLLHILQPSPSPGRINRLVRDAHYPQFARVFFLVVHVVARFPIIAIPAWNAHRATLAALGLAPT